MFYTEFIVNGAQFTHTQSIPERSASEAKRFDNEAIQKRSEKRNRPAKIPPSSHIASRAVKSLPRISNRCLGPLQPHQLSGQSVPGQLIDHVDGFRASPMSLGLGLGGLRSSACSKAIRSGRRHQPLGLSIRHIQRIHGV